VLEETDGRVGASVRGLDESALPAGNVSVAVEHSTLNCRGWVRHQYGLRGNDDFLQTW